MRRHLSRSERGAVLVFVAPLVAALFGITALVVDMGNARQESRHVQGAADAAALAGARELPVGPPPDQSVADAAAENAKGEASRYVNLNLSGANAFPAPLPSCESPISTDSTCYDFGDTTLMVTTPYDQAPPRSPKPYSLIHVRICQPTATFFAGVMGLNSPTVCQEAVGTLENESGGFGMGLVVTHPTACGALEFAGASSTVLSSNGAVMVNSDCPTNALDASGSAWRLTSSYIGVVGGAALAPCDPEMSSTCTDTVPEEGIFPFDDPLGDTHVPTASEFDPSGEHSCSPSDGTRVMLPGKYPNSCTFNHNDGYILRPGTYYFSSGFSMNGSSDIVCHDTADTMADIPELSDPENVDMDALRANCVDGVTLIIGGGSISLNGSSTVSLPPPPDGPYAGISIYQLSSSDSTINGSNNFLLGTIYAPNAHYNFTGSGGADGDKVNIEGMVVTRTADISGSFRFKIDVPEDSPQAYPKDQLTLWE